MPLATDQQPEQNRLSPIALQFIALRDAVMDHWEREVRAQVKGAHDLLGPVLSNTVPSFLDNIAEALSPEHPRERAASGTNVASAHGQERARMTPYGPDQVVQEYQLLRESIAEVVEDQIKLSKSDWRIIDRSINEATREAVRAFTRSHGELRGKVAATLSHDMRTPLAVIVSYAQLIGIAPDLVRARGFAFKIESTAARMGVMMEELLDALTFHGGAKIPLHLTCFNALDLANEVRDQYREHNKTAIGFEVAGEPVLGFWCRGSLRRALENLVNNAIKYGDDTGVIRIKACEIRGNLALSVHNEGNPIPEDQRDRIFDYLRREGGSPMATGWGIGLPFVKAVAENHGGSVTVDSAPQTGTTFLLDMPVDCRPYVDKSHGGSADVF